MKQDLNKLMCLDLYLSGTPAQSEASIENVTKVDSILPLVSWDVFSDSYFKQLIASKKAMDIKKINAYAKDTTGKMTCKQFLTLPILRP